MTTMNIHGVNYKIIDTKEKMTVPDNFVITSNKIIRKNKEKRSSGESMFYIGNDNSELRDFFGDKGFNIKCFILKKDLIRYMEDCKTEYLNPEQLYTARNEMPKLWEERLEKIEKLPEFMPFTMYELDYRKPPRVYVHAEPRNNNPYYNIIREISLPNISYLAAIKLEADDGSTVFYFRLFIDYFGEVENSTEVEKEVEKIESSNVENEEKIQLTRARVGQGKYRIGVLELCPFCPVTLVSDDRLLIASHIKPWAKANEEEKIDPKNGFMFTPTIDFLFDRGFITFTNDKKMIISPWLSKMTCSKLNIAPDKKYDFLPTNGRENYLDYHRSNIFKS